MHKKISLNEAAVILDINPQTLRRWDDGGALKARRDTLRAHRYYLEDDLENFLSSNYKYLLNTAVRWAFSERPIYIPYRFYCDNSNLFKVRLAQFGVLLQREEGFSETFSLVTSALGEIGNNSFDHNIGNWPDIPGIFFGYSLSERKAIVVDRGQGVLATLKRVRPSLLDDKDAIEVAFTEFITGRSSEHRGNGLKYVRDIVQDNHMNLWFHSGLGAIDIKGDSEEDLTPIDITKKMRGCFIIIEY